MMVRGGFRDVCNNNNKRIEITENCENILLSQLIGQALA